MRCLIAGIAVGLTLILSASAQGSGEVPRFCQVPTANAALAASAKGADQRSPTGVVLLINKDRVVGGELVYARLANFREDNAVEYGREFAIQRRTSDGWERDPASPKGPWPRAWGLIDPEGAGRCYVFHVPPKQTAGHYRFSTGVQLSPKTKRGLVWRYGTFSVREHP